MKGCSRSCQHSLLSSESAFYILAVEKSGKSPSNSKLNSYKLGWLLSSSHPFRVCDESTRTLPDKKFQNIWHETSHHCLPCALELLFHEKRQGGEKTKKRKISISTKIILCLKIVSFDNKKSINSRFKLPNFSPFRVAPTTVGRWRAE